ncbi:MFS transporter [Alicyclobacillaceae bacterium I2511]|nr:MFS transporter [Alicyclobacillaceae bacterium I2511]
MGLGRAGLVTFDSQRRNYLLMFLDNMLFTSAMTFLSINTVLTYFLNHLGATTFEISLANALVSIGAVISQPVFVKKLVSLSYKLHTFVRILLTQRLFMLLFVATVPLLAPRHPHWMIVWFLVAWGIFNFFVGSYSPFYMSVFAKMIAVSDRGRLRGYSASAGNGIALIAAYLIGVILKEVAYPFNYTLLLGLGALLLLLDALDFALMKEQPDQVIQVEVNYFRYFRDIPAVLRRNKAFARMVLAFSLMVIAQVGLVYYSLYAIRVYHAQAVDIAWFTATGVFVNILGNIGFGILADRFSHRLVLEYSAVLGALAGLAALSIHHLAGVYIAFALSNLCLSGYNLSSSILVVENTTLDQVPMHISVNVMVTLLVSSAVTLLTGALVSQVSFLSIFVLVLLAGALSSWVMHTLPIGTSGGTLTLQKAKAQKNSRP